MSELSERFDRSIRLFGKEGQRRLQQVSAAVVGVSGLGTPLVQQLALLGVKKLILIDPEELDETNRNRFIGARWDDPIPGSSKVDLSARLVREIYPDIDVIAIKSHLCTQVAFDGLYEADWVFGCLDEDGPRLVLNEFCAAYKKAYVDTASDVPEPNVYGGRILVSLGGGGCLHCMGLLNEDDIRRFMIGEEAKHREDAIYGVDREALETTGPSVAPINAVVASLAATEFMVSVTGLREPKRLINYRGDLARTTVSKDMPRCDCYYCNAVYGQGRSADVERYLKKTVSQHL